MTGTPRYPFVKLEPFLTAWFGMPRWEREPARTWGNRNEMSFTIEAWSDSDAAVLFGVDRRQICRWRAEGISLLKAEQLAGRLLRMPWEIWPEWAADADGWADERIAAAEERYARKLADNAARKRRLAAAR